MKICFIAVHYFLIRPGFISAILKVSVELILVIGHPNWPQNATILQQHYHWHTMILDGWPEVFSRVAIQSIERNSGVLTDLSPRPSVCLSGKCTVTKRLTGSGCRLG